MLFSSKPPQSSERVDAPRARRHSTTISMMEEEFGMREPPQAGTRFGGSSEWPLSPLSFPDRIFLFMCFLALALPSMLTILPPKRKKTLTQIPEPRRNSSLLKGSWETVWGCDVNDV